MLFPQRHRSELYSSTIARTVTAIPALLDHQPEVSEDSEAHHAGPTNAIHQSKIKVTYTLISEATPRMTSCSSKNNKWDDSSQHQSFSRVIVYRGIT